MKIILKTCSVFLLIFLLAFSVAAQSTVQWSETDRKYLLDNLVHSRDLLVHETINLTPAQWQFKEAPDRWSIKEVAEHIALWELLFDREISMALSAGPQVDLAQAAKPDSVILGFIMEEKPHVTTDYTKPFTYSVPTGLYRGEDNVKVFLKRREESIAFFKNYPVKFKAVLLKVGPAQRASGVH